MKVEITYPPVEKKKFQRRRFLNIVRWPVLFAVYMCPIVNLLTGGKAWSTVVLMSLYMLWTLVLSPDLVEYNRISQFIKAITFSCILLWLIDVFLAPGWAIEVVPMVCFCGLFISGILFFTDLERQKQNMLPLLSLITFALIGSAVGLYFFRGKTPWPIVVMGAVALALLVALMTILREDFLRELKRRFHVK